MFDGNFILKDKSLTKNPIFNLSGAIVQTHVLLAAFQLGFIDFLAKNNPMNFNQIRQFLGFTPRATQAFISLLCSIGLIDCNLEEEYYLTNISKCYLISDSPFYWGHWLSEVIHNPKVLSYENFMDTLASNAAQIYEGKDIFEVHEKDMNAAKNFTYAMHSKSMSSAVFWPKIVNLSRHKLFLDIGGGSGAHSIAVVR
jgi:hypothetical protein